MSNFNDSAIGDIVDLFYQIRVAASCGQIQVT